MAEALMKYETIDATQLKDIMEGRDPRPPEGWDDGDSPGGGTPVNDDKPQVKAEDDASSNTSGGDASGGGDSGDNGEEDDDEPRRRPSDPLGGPTGP